MTNRKTILLFVTFVLCFLCKAQEKKFVINGHLKNKSLSKKVFFIGEEDGQAFLDSTNHFTYSGTLKEPFLLSIYTENSWEYTGIWATEGQSDVVLEEYFMKGMDPNGKTLLKIVSVTSSEETEKNQWFYSYRNNLNETYKHLPLAERKDSIDKDLYPALQDYVAAHPDSKFSVFIINMYAEGLVNKDKLLSSLTRGNNAEEALRLEREIKRERLLSKGNSIANFQQPQLNGKMFSLNSLLGQYVLLEFWASDCPPCRADNPELIKIYNEYHGKGLEIVGISLDDSKEAWRKAVKKDRLPWIQVSDLKGWDNAVSSRYAIYAIPFNVLLDKDHNVIASNLRVDTLNAKLKELLGKQKPAVNTAFIK